MCLKLLDKFNFCSVKQVSAKIVNVRWRYIWKTLNLGYPISFREVNIDQTVEERSHCQRGKKLSGKFSAIFHLILPSTTKWRSLWSRPKTPSLPINSTRTKRNKLEECRTSKCFRVGFPHLFYSVYQFEIDKYLDK